MSKLNELLSKIISKLNASVKTEAQSFTEEEKAQARENIGAVPTPNHAETGQALVVKTVDENGVPTEWGVADLCAGAIEIDTVITRDGVALTSEESANILAAIDSFTYVTCLCSLDYNGTTIVCPMSVIEDSDNEYLTLVSETDGLRILMSVMEDGSVVAMYEPPENKLPEVTLATTITQVETELDESEWAFFDDAAAAETPIICKFAANIDQAATFNMVMDYVRDPDGLTVYMAHVGPYTISIHKSDGEKWKCTGFVQEPFTKSEVVSEAVSAAMNALPDTIPNIQSAKVDQAVVVKAVDENGVPTEWEAADVKLPEITLSQPMTTEETLVTEEEGRLLDESYSARSAIICHVTVSEHPATVIMYMYCLTDPEVIVYNGTISDGDLDLRLFIVNMGDAWMQMMACTDIYRPSLAADYTIANLPTSIPKVSSAKVGQIIAVKEIGLTGNPTAWEVVDQLAVDASLSVEGAAADAKAVGEKLDEYATKSGVINNGYITFVASSSDGVNYTATVEGLTEIKKGQVLIMLPNKTSASANVQLNINELGNKRIYRRTTGTNVEGGSSVDWLAFNRAYILMYSAGAWEVVNIPKISATDIHGSIPIESGGHGGTTAKEARANLGITPENIGAMPADADVVTSINGQTGAVTLDIPVELPVVTAADKGKFLRVSADGTWVAETILNAEEVAF